MQDTLKSLLLWFKDRISSPFWWYFLISWILINYNILYLLLFQSEDTIFKTHNITKYDYIVQVFTEINHNVNLFGILNIPSNILSFIIEPFILSLLLLLLFPFLDNFIYRKYLHNKSQKIRIKKENDIENMNIENVLKLKKLEQKELEVKEKEMEQKERRIDENIINQWKEEYSKFKNTYYAKFLKEIVNDIYTGLWRLKDIPESIISYYLVNDLIEKDDNDDWFPYYYWTDKLQYFAKVYFNENEKEIAGEDIPF